MSNMIQNFVKLNVSIFFFNLDDGGDESSIDSNLILTKDIYVEDPLTYNHFNQQCVSSSHTITVYVSGYKLSNDRATNSCTNLFCTN